MNREEYCKVEKLSYEEYCEYLKNKYGIVSCDYMTKSFNKNKKCRRTNDGLFVHHIKEIEAELLSNPNIASEYPFEWQQKENLVYCDFLEHVLLHIMIGEQTGALSSGLEAFIIPELNDVYGGWISKEQWRINCHKVIKDDKDVYLMLLKRYVEQPEKDKETELKYICHSFNGFYGYWSDEKNKELYKEIREYIFK